MAKAKHASSVGVHLANTVIAELDRRAALVGYTRSKYAGALITRWYARGAKPILAIEAEELKPIRLPDGCLTFLGAEMRSGHSVTKFADDVPALMVAEEQTPYLLPSPSSKKAPGRSG